MLVYRKEEVKEVRKKHFESLMNVNVGIRAEMTSVGV